MTFDAVALTWPPSAVHGWGVFGANLVRDLLRRGAPRPLLLAPIIAEHLEAQDQRTFAPLIAEQAQIERQTAEAQGAVTINGVAVVHSLGNGLIPQPINQRFRGTPNVGFTFFERTDFPPDIVARAAWLDIVVAGSSWNADVLRDIGFSKVGCVFQGVDPETFRPGPAAGRFGERFVVFSGGKLELRKGQDLVIEAFKRFHESHPEAFLVTAWMTPWPRLMADIAASPWTQGAPDPDAGFPASIENWVRDQGIPEGAHKDISPVLNSQMPLIFNDCHAGLFLNRCEGGTNLVAMEAMAMGLPCVLSANSGHLDLIAPATAMPNCYPLDRQEPTSFAPEGGDHWRESDLDDAVAALEAIYDDRAEAQRRGAAARAFMTDWHWPNQIDRLLTTLNELSE